MVECQIRYEYDLAGVSSALDAIPLSIEQRSQLQAVSSKVAGRCRATPARPAAATREALTKAAYHLRRFQALVSDPENGSENPDKFLSSIPPALRAEFRDMLEAVEPWADRLVKINPADHSQPMESLIDILIDIWHAVTGKPATVSTYTDDDDQRQVRNGFGSWASATIEATGATISPDKLEKYVRSKRREITQKK